MVDKKSFSNPKTALMIFFVVSALAMLANMGYKAFLQKPDLPKELMGVVLPQAREIKPFELTDHQGKRFDLDRFKGKWSFMFFGYTHCPDVCPVSMGLLGAVFDKLKGYPEILANTQGIFVSVDPVRDTVAVLKEYVPYFHPDFLGVTGDETQIKDFAKGLGAAAVFSPPGSDGSYQVSHTSSFYLIDPKGIFFALFQPQFHDANAIVATYQLIHKLNLH